MDLLLKWLRSCCYRWHSGSVYRGKPPQLGRDNILDIQGSKWNWFHLWQHLSLNLSFIGNPQGVQKASKRGSIGRRRRHVEMGKKILCSAYFCLRGCGKVALVVKLNQLDINCSAEYLWSLHNIHFREFVEIWMRSLQLRNGESGGVSPTTVNRLRNTSCVKTHIWMVNLVKSN